MNNLRFPLPYQKCTINFKLCPRSYHKFMKQRALEANCIVEKGESSILNPNALNQIFQNQGKSILQHKQFLQKLLSTTKQLITLATSNPSGRMYRLHYGFATNKILKTTSIHECDKIQLSFRGLFRGCWLAAAVFTFPKSVPWNFSLESRYRVP